MFTSRFKYNYHSIRERFGLSVDDVANLIDLGLLLPDNWYNYNETERLNRIASDFHLVVWDIMEVERFEKILQLLQKNVFPGMHRIINNLDQIKGEVGDGFTALKEQNKLLEKSILDLRDYIRKQDSWLGTREFCELTGYSRNYVWNHLEKIDAKQSRLDIFPYQKIVWIRRGKGKGQLYCKRVDFDDARRPYLYEISIEEKKRKGEYVAPVRIQIREKFKS